MSDREVILEAQIVAFAERRGWWTAKFMSPGTRGVPDRIFIRAKFDEGKRVVFIEVKKLDEVPTPQQLKRHREMREHGAEVYWTDNLESAKEWLK